MIESLIVKAIVSFFKTLATDGLQALGTVFAWINGLAISYLDSGPVVTGIRVAQGVAMSLLTVKVGAEALRVWVLHTSGDAAADPGGLLRRTAYAAGMIFAAPEVVRYTYLFGSKFAQDVANNVTATPPDQLAAMLTGGLETAGGVVQGLVATLFLPVVMIVAIVLIFVVLAQVAIRSVEIGFLAVAGPIVAIGLTAENEGVWGIWWRNLASLAITQVVQVFLLMSAGAAMIATAPIINIFMFLAVMWVTVRSPAAIKEFAHHTGIGGAAGAAGQSAGAAVLFRMIATRGGG